MKITDWFKLFCKKKNDEEAIPEPKAEEPKMPSYPETPEALPLPKLSGDQLKDIVRVAYSQLGYKAAYDANTKKKYSIYGDWTGQHGCEWCSEFVSWCAEMAEVPKSTIPREIDSRRFAKTFAAMGRYYVLEENKHHANNCPICQVDQYISFREIIPGDIIIMDMNGIWCDGSEHIGLCVDIHNGYIDIVEGNYDNGVEKIIRNSSCIHGICRPDYDRNIND